MICFLCKKQIDCVNLLIFHLKKIHSLSSNSTYRCFEPLCIQSFQNLNSFRKHMLRKHLLSKGRKIKINEKVINLPFIPSKEQNKTVNLPEEHNTTDKNNFISSPMLQNSQCESEQIKKTEDFDAESAAANILKSAIKFSLFLHSNHNFARKDVYSIQDNIKNLIINPMLDIFKSFSYSHFKNDPIIFNEFVQLINRFKKLFEQCSSDYLLHECLKRDKYLETPKEFVINSEIRPIHQSGELSYHENIAKGVMLPLRFQFKKFFEGKNNLIDMLNYMHSLKNSAKIVNFIQGSLWKNKSEMYPNKITIPYFLYNDDFEVNNPLGSHSAIHSVCNFYYSFPCLPFEESKLENIFLAMVVKSQDIKSFGNDNSLESLIHELKYLEEEGINIMALDGKIYHVHFILGLILGDNLGLNTILNFNKSFSSNYFCRFCKINKKESQTLCIENPEVIRNTENYKDDVAVNDASLTGIRGDSLLNSIPSFHVVENFSVDAMHDLFEGVCHYDLCHILSFFIKQMKYFTLETLNKRKQSFEYGPTEIGNISNEIKISHLTNLHLRMSAREMMTFVTFLPIMIADLVPDDDEVWKFLINLIEIIEVILSFETTNESVKLLENRIKAHNSDYIRLFKDTLKPKFHNLLHYPRVIYNSGPIRKIWCFKFESKHKQFKVYAHAITSRKNICLTLAKKFQLNFANLLVNGFTENSIYKVNEKDEIDSNFRSFICLKLEAENFTLKFYKKLEYKNIIYKNGYYVAKFTEDYRVYLIKNVILCNETISLFCQEIKSISYEPHSTSFIIDPDSLGEYSILKMSDIIGPPFTIIKTVKGKNVIKIKEYYFTV